MTDHNDGRRRRLPSLGAGAALALVLLAACAPAPQPFDRPDNVVWVELLLSSGVDSYRDGRRPRIDELSLEEAARMLEVCLSQAVETACGERLLAAHPHLRGPLLRYGWPRGLASIGARFVPELLARGAPVDGQAVHWAMQRRVEGKAERLEIMRHLLAAGAPVEGEKAAERTPLHMAAEQGDVALVGLLLGRGADPQRRTRQGATALDLALAQGAGEVAVLLGGRSP